MKTNKAGQMEKYDGPPKDMGSAGDLPRTVKWILEHEPRNAKSFPGNRKVDVDYLGRSTKWPHGCYKVFGEGIETQYLNPRQVIWVAREVLGMAHEDADSRDKDGKKTGENEWDVIMSLGAPIPTEAESTNRDSDSRASEGGKSPSSTRSSTGASKGSGARGRTGGASTATTTAAPGTSGTRTARGTRPTGSSRRTSR